MAFGVDLGTTNSSIAWTDENGNIVSLKVRRGPKEPFDSVERSLVLDPLGDVPVVGHLAEGAYSENPKALLVGSFKRRFDKPRLRESILTFEQTPTQDYDPVNQCIRYRESARWVPLMYDDYSIDEVIAAGALILNRLLTATEIAIDGPSSAEGRSVLDRLRGKPKPSSRASQSTLIDAVAGERLFVGVPVSFGPTARRRFLRALVASGCFGGPPDAYLEVLRRCRLIYEPLALASTLSLFESQNVFIVDYGGGTLDLALLRVELDDVGRNVKELALGGLGSAGDRLDEAFRDLLLAADPALRRTYEQAVKKGGEDRWQAVSAFAKAKVALSTQDRASMRLFGDAEATRGDLERAIGPHVDEAIAAIHQTLAQGGIRPDQVGTVLLTGGSSLIPLVQDRIRDVFSHLDDLAFDAGVPGDTESERRTLTGVSRGLANFGFLQSFEASAPCSFGVVVPGFNDTPLRVLERGSPDVLLLEESPCVAIPVTDGCQSFAVYSDLLRETYCGALVDLPLVPGTVEVDVRLSADRQRFAPAFSVTAAGTELGRFDLEAMSGTDLQRWAEGDCEWLPATIRLPTRPFLVRPLELGDFAEWRYNGAGRRGKIVEIRDIATGEQVELMDGLDPHPYAIKVAGEVNRVVLFGQVASPTWKVGDVRLA